MRGGVRGGVRGVEGVRLTVSEISKVVHSLRDYSGLVLPMS